LAAGPTNLGKTRSMWALLKRLSYNDSIQFTYFSARFLFVKIQDYIKNGNDPYQWIQSIALEPIVFIDDFGQQALLSSREDYINACFFQFLNTRVEHRLPLLMTTNLTSNQMAERTNEVRADPLIRRLLDIADVIKF